MKFSGKIEHGTSTKPLNFGGDPRPWWRFVLSDCTLRGKICALRVLLVCYKILIHNPYASVVHLVGVCALQMLI